MKQLDYTFLLAEPAFDLLYKISEVGSAEYRDFEFESLTEFREKVRENHFLTEEQFLSRNFGGTYYLINDLLEFNLIKSDDMCWHTTYVISEFGKKVLTANRYI